jgi:hypothetical protein
LPVLTIGAAYLLIARVRSGRSGPGQRVAALTTLSTRTALTAMDALLLGAAAVSALGRAHPGGDDNVRLPVFALLCLCAAAPIAASALTAARRAARRWLCLALLAQLALLWQPPSAHVPAASSARDWHALTSTLQRCGNGGPTVALDHALLTGKPFVHTMALSDLRMGKDEALAAAGTSALLAALADSSAPAAIAVGTSFAQLDRTLARHYRRCALVRAPRMATGYQPGRMQDGARVLVVYARAPNTSPAATFAVTCCSARRKPAETSAR